MSNFIQIGTYPIMVPVKNIDTNWINKQREIILSVPANFNDSQFSRLPDNGNIIIINNKQTTTIYPCAGGT